MVGNDTVSISLLIIIASLSMEILVVLNRNTTFKSSTRIILIYDLFYLMSVFIGYMFLSDKYFILMLLIVSIPYWPLVKNASTKYKALIGDRYPVYFVEHLNTKMAVLENRVKLLAMGVAGIISAVSSSPEYIVVVFILASLLQSVWSIRAYRKYYGVFKR